MMKTIGITVVAVAVLMSMPGRAVAQTAARVPRPPATQTPPAPAAPPAPAVAPAPPAPPAAPGPPPRAGQPINVKVELTITEDGGNTAPIKKTITAVVGDAFSGYVREQFNNPTTGRFVPLNLDAYPVVLSNGKIRLTCTIQYFAASAPPPAPQNEREQAFSAKNGTDIRQNLVLILESGKSLVVSQATDPVSDRRVTVEVMATILK